jgi:hypothetical protein
LREEAPPGGGLIFTSVPRRGILRTSALRRSMRLVGLVL